MKQYNHFLQLFLVFFAFLMLFVLFSVPVSATDTSGTLESGQTWSFDAVTGILTVTGTGELQDYPAPWRAWGDDIKLVILSEGITDTGNNTFRGLKNLTEVKLPTTLKIVGQGAFSEAEKLKEIIIPANVTEIGMFAFQNCMELSNVSLPSGLLTIGNRAFNNCDAIVSITVPASVILIDNYAFGECQSLEEVTILGAPRFGDEVMSVSKLVRFCGGPPVFESKSLYGVSAECHYPKNDIAWASVVTNTYGGTLDWFASDNPINVEFPKFDDTKSGSCGPDATWSLTSGVLIVSGSGKMDRVAWDRYKHEIQKVIIHEGLTELPSCAFLNCTDLKSVTLANTLTDIGGVTFAGCTSLSNVTLPVGLVEIHMGTFRNCTALKEIIIPSGVTTIGEHAFENTGLEKVTLSNSLTKIGTEAFLGCVDLKEIYFPASLTFLGDGAFYGCTGLNKLYFAGDPPVVCNHTFRDVNAIAYYPAGNKFWKDRGMAYHGGYIPEKPLGVQNVCDHAYGDWIVTLQPTTETPGQQQRVCTSCGDIQTSQLPAIENTLPTSPATEPNTLPATEPSVVPSIEPSSSPETRPDSTSPAPTQPVGSEIDPKKNDTVFAVCIVLVVAIIGVSAVWFFWHKRKQ